jgi:hypothetical protein
VLNGLPEALRKEGVDVQDLLTIPPASIENNSRPAIGGTKFATFREVWNVVNCIASMKSNGKYEAAGVLWWFMLLGAEANFQKRRVFKIACKRLAVEAASSHWSEATFVASDTIEHRRFFTFPGNMPTACSGLPDVEQTMDQLVGGKVAKVPIFKGLPLLAGRPLVLSYLEAVAGAMQQGGERLKKLFEATACIRAIMSSKPFSPI